MPFDSSFSESPGLPSSLYDERGNEVKKRQMWRFSPLWGDLSSQSSADTPRIDVSREDDHLVVKAVLPGVRKEHIHLTLEGEALCLRWELREDTASKLTSRWFFRRLPLGFEADPARITSSLKDGLLEVTFPVPTHREPSRRTHDSRSPLDATSLFLELTALAARYELISLPASPTMDFVRRLVRLFDDCLATVNGIAGLEGMMGTLVRHTALQASFPALRLFYRGDWEAALHFLLLEWARASAALGLSYSFTGLPEEPEASYNLPPDETEHELLAVFNTAVSTLLHEAEGHSRGRGAIRRLMTQLDLSFDQVGRALGVSGETVRRWERGSHEIPAERMADLLSADAALERLLGVFRAERLAVVVRRQAALFSGESALDWIFRGRIGEVADRYEVALSYQG